MTKRTQLNRSLISKLAHNKEGSFGTHAKRSQDLQQAMSELGELFPHLKNVNNLKTKHIDALVQSWKERELSSGTLKNRVSHLRWLAQKIGKQNIVKRTNQEYEIDDRKYVDNQKNIAKTLSTKDLDKISNQFVRRSLLLQIHFGLRREESIKFTPKLADKGDRIELKGSWCKGGRARTIPVRTVEQRELLNELKQFCRDNQCRSMIPQESNYKQQESVYDTQTQRAGLTNNHGLRHQYAQSRYEELTGWECPKNGGPGFRDLSKEQKELDHKVRLEISEELGHSREEITAVYLGR